MSGRTIDDYIKEELPLNDHKIALEFIQYLKNCQLEFVKDNGYWKEKIYYIVKYKNECVCFIAINDPDEKENKWTIWSDDMGSEYLINQNINSNIKELAWKHIDPCGNCGSCGGGRYKSIFGKEFDNVCGCTFRVNNPNAEDIQFLKTMIDLRIQEISHLTL